MHACKAAVIVTADPPFGEAILAAESPAAKVQTNDTLEAHRVDYVAAYSSPTIAHYRAISSCMFAKDGLPSPPMRPARKWPFTARGEAAALLHITVSKRSLAFVGTRLNHFGILGSDMHMMTMISSKAANAGMREHAGQCIMRCE